MHTIRFKSVVLVKTACQNNACFVSDSQLTRSTGAKEKSNLSSISLNNYINAIELTQVYNL